MKALILTGGSCAADVRVPEYDICIAADCGIELADRLGVTPDLTVGDFDSADTANHAPKGEIIRHPSHKNQTDTMLARDLAVERGCDVIYILGGLGGGTVAVLNFLWMGLMVQKAAAKAGDQDAVKTLVKGSYSQRMLFQMLWVIIAIVAPCFHFVAGIVPLLFPGTGIKIAGIFHTKK